MKIFLLAVLLCGATLVPATFAGPTPRATVQIFLNAAKSGNVSGVKQQMHSGAQLGNGDAEGILAMQIMFSDARIKSVEYVSRTRAIVYVSVQDPLSRERQNVPFSVSKSGSNWLIDDNSF